MSDIKNKETVENTAVSKEGERFYQCLCPHGQYRSAIVFAWICIISAFAVHIACGSVSAVFADSVIYTCIHSLLCVAVYGSLLYSIINITKGKKKLPESVYVKETKMIALGTLLALILSLGGIAYEIISMVASDGGRNILAVILCVVLHLFSAFAVFAARLSVMGLPFRIDSEN